MLCSKCHIDKPEELFSRDKQRASGRYPFCKSCVRILGEAYRNREKPLPDPTQLRECNKCHVLKTLDEFYKDASRKDGYTLVCKICRCAQRQAYAESHPEKVHLDKLAWKKTPEGKACHLRYYANNREAINQRKNKRYAENPELFLASARKWRIANPEHARVIMQRGNAARQERLKNAPINDLTKAQWLEILQLFSYRCAYCNQHSNWLEQDHIIPITKHGPHTKSNVVPACRSCNARKGNRAMPTPHHPVMIALMQQRNAAAD